MAVVALPSSAAAQSQQPLTTYASVLDNKGTPVTTLTARDFIVREDGVDREITSVAPANQPLRIALLVDTSQRMDRNINEVRRALRAFIASTHGQSEIALYEFGERPMLLVNYTRDPGLLEAGIGRIFARPGSGAYLLDAVIDAARSLRGAEGVRSEIVVITTQSPEFSNRFHDTVLKELRASHATLHSFILDRSNRLALSTGAREREIALDEGARLTGGRREHLLTVMSLSDRLQSLSRELAEQYRVTYTRPDGLIPPRAVDIAVRGARLTVRASRVPVSALGR
jgi:Ca-activated chloride channel family protein